MKIEGKSDEENWARVVGKADKKSASEGLSVNIGLLFSVRKTSVSIWVGGVKADYGF